MKCGTAGCVWQHTQNSENLKKLNIRLVETVFKKLVLSHTGTVIAIIQRRVPPGVHMFKVRGGGGLNRQLGQAAPEVPPVISEGYWANMQRF